MEHFNNDDLEYVVDEYYDVPDFAVEDTSSDIVPELLSIRRQRQMCIRDRC